MKIIHAHLVVAIARLFWFEAKNERLQTGYGSSEKAKEVRERFKSAGGWKPTSIVESYPLSAADKVLAMTFLEDKFAVLRTAANAGEPKAEMALKAFMLQRCDPDGKLIVPDLGPNMAFRRSREFPIYLQEDMEVQLQADPGCTPVLNDKIPVSVVEYDNWEEMVIRQQMENADEQSRVDLTEENKLLIVQKLYRRGVIEQRIIGLYGKARAQKFHGICEIDHEFPGVNLVERFCRKPTEDGFLRLSKYSPDKINQFTQRIKADKKRRAGKTLSEKEMALVPLTAEVLENELTTSGSAKMETVMKKKEIEGIKQTLGAGSLFNDFTDAILTNDKSKIVALQETAGHGLDMHGDLIKAGHSKLVEDSLAMMKANPDAMQKVAALGSEKIKDLFVLEDELTSTKAELAKVKADYAKVQAELLAVQTELANVKTELASKKKPVKAS